MTKTLIFLGIICLALMGEGEGEGRKTGRATGALNTAVVGVLCRADAVCGQHRSPSTVAMQLACIHMHQK